MEGKICMVTGANAGIGKAAAIELARRGATVLMVSRTRERGEATQSEIVEVTGNKHVELFLADLSSQVSIREMVKAVRARYDHLNVLVNNAGVFQTKRLNSEDGLEMTFATNHLGYFMPTMLLWDCLAAGTPARVINVASDAHRGAKLNFDDLQSMKSYSGYKAYGRSKLANLLFTYELHRRRDGAGVTINAVHPGFVASNFGRNNSGVVGFAMRHIVPWFARSVDEGAATIIYLATSPEVVGVSGQYFVDCKPVRSSPESYDEAAARQLWAVSEALTGVALPLIS